MWKYKNLSAARPRHDQLYVGICNATDPAQRFVLAVSGGTVLQSRLSGLCLDASVTLGPIGTFAPCDRGKAAQDFALNATSGHFELKSSGRCLDVYAHVGPNVDIGGCKTPGANDANQRFAVEQVGGVGAMVLTALPRVAGLESCLTVSKPDAGGDGLLHVQPSGEMEHECGQSP